MGLFALPPKPRAECTAEDFIDTAMWNLKLWKDDGCKHEHDYLVTMSISYLNDAMRQMRPFAGQPVGDDTLKSTDE
jgi:hypothetical protein